MFERLSHIAAQAATNVSRREFVSSLGRGALAAAAALGGLLALSADAEAARGCPNGRVKVNCTERGRKRGTLCCPPNYRCQRYRSGWICCPRGRICR
jgi:hypothetical protein